MSDIGELQEYAFLVPVEFKVYLRSVDRVAFTLDGLKFLRDHPVVPLELRDDLADFIESIV
jgi:hypothetical protein